MNPAACLWGFSVIQIIFFLLFFKLKSSTGRRFKCFISHSWRPFQFNSSTGRRAELISLEDGVWPTTKPDLTRLFWSEKRNILKLLNLRPVDVFLLFLFFFYLAALQSDPGALKCLPYILYILRPRSKAVIFHSEHTNKLCSHTLQTPLNGDLDEWERVPSGGICRHSWPESGSGKPLHLMILE